MLRIDKIIKDNENKKTNELTNRIEVLIYSRQKMEEKLKRERLEENSAIISFYDTPMIDDDPYCVPIAYPSDIVVYYSQTDDIAFENLQARGYTEDSYFMDCDAMAKFILDCAAKSITTFICQCEFGQSRSSGAAAAIAEFFNHNGIEIFADYRYLPNQVIYNKLIRALVAQNFFNQIGV